MFTSTHTAAAIPIMLIFPNWIGVAICLGSHFALDTCAEADCYENLTQTVFIDFIIISGAICIVAINHPYAIWLTLGIFASQFPDIYDKVRDKIFHLPQHLSCHIPGWPVYWQMTKSQTIVTNLLSAFVAILLLSL